MIDLARVLRIVVETLEASASNYLVVGSTAAATWGVVRTTRGVDVVVAVSTSEVAALAQQLVAANVYVPDSVLAGDESNAITSFNVLDSETGGKVDVFVATDGDAFTASRIDRRIRAEVFGVPCWIATAEDVLLAKLHWRRDSRSEVQWRDCVEIAAINDLDMDYLRRWSNELEIVDDLEQLIGEINQEKSNG